MSNKKILGLVLGLVTMWSNSLQAAIITVTTETDELDSDTNCSLREAIYNANNDVQSYSGCIAGSGDDTIILEDGETYYLSLTTGQPNEDFSAEGDLDILGSNSLTITSTGQSIIDASAFGGAGFPDRILHVLGSGNVTLSNISFQNANFDVGMVEEFGGVLLFAGGGNLSIENCSFNDNTVTVRNVKSILGGVLAVTSAGTISITDSSFHNNQILPNGSATGGATGGTIYASSFDSITIDNSDFYSSSLEINNTFQGGVATFLGDGSNSSVTVTESQFYENSITPQQNNPTAFGGILHASNTDLNIFSSIFRENVVNIANGVSGGIISYDSDSATDKNFSLVNSIVTLNSTFSSAGIGTIYVSGSTSEARFSYSTIVGNQIGDSSSSSATSMGGGIAVVENSSLFLKSNILSNNEIWILNNTGIGENCYTSSTVNPVSLGYNIIENISDCGLTLTATDLETDPQLEAFSNYGGDILTYSLAATSPAKNIEAAATCTDANGNNVTTDIRGASRGDGACDAGSFELNSFFTDADGDGFGDATQTTGSTAYAEGAAINNLDCDDGNDTVSPSADELCEDAIDNDCDGNIDTDDSSCVTPPAGDDDDDTTPPAGDDDDDTTPTGDDDDDTTPAGDDDDTTPAGDDDDDDTTPDPSGGSSSGGGGCQLSAANPSSLNGNGLIATLATLTILGLRMRKQKTQTTASSQN